MHDASESYVNCPDCLALPERRGSYEPQPTIRDAVVVRNWPGVASSHLKHFIDVGNIIAKYEVELALIDCSRDGHPHRIGHIAVTRCGLVLRQGNQCARKSSNMDGALDFYREREVHLDRIGRLRVVPVESLAALTDLVPVLTSYATFQRDHERSEEAREMRRRKRLGARGKLVEFRSFRQGLPGERSRLERWHEDLVGLEFWSADFEGAACSAWLEEAKSLVLAVEVMDETNRDHVKVLAAKCEALAEATTRCKKLLDVGGQYMSPANRRRVERALLEVRGKTG